MHPMTGLKAQASRYGIIIPYFNLSNIQTAILPFLAYLQNTESAKRHVKKVCGQGGA